MTLMTMLPLYGFVPTTDGTGLWWGCGSICNGKKIVVKMLGKDSFEVYTWEAAIAAEEWDYEEEETKVCRADEVITLIFSRKFYD